MSRTTIRGAQLALIGFVSSQVITFGAYIVLARLISPADFGRYAAATVITGVGSLFAESGMLSALINRRDRIEEAASTAFCSLVVSGSLLTVAALATAPVVGLFFHSGQVSAVAAVLSGWLFLSALTVVPDALLQRRFSFARRVAADPLGAAAFAAVSIVSCASGAGIWGLVAGAYASMLVQVGSVWMFAHFRPRIALASVAMWRELASFARPVLGSEVLRRVGAQLDAIALGRFQGAAPLGQYRNGLRLAQQPAQAFVDVASYVLLPAFAHLSGEPARLASAARRVYGLVAVATVPVTFATVALGKPVAVLLLGPKWGPAGDAIAGLCGLTAGGAAVSVAAEIFKSSGRPRLLVRMHTVGLCSLVATVIAGAILFGTVGVAVAVSISTVLTAAYAGVKVSPMIGLRPLELVDEYLKPALASAVMLAGMLGFVEVTNPLAHRGFAAWGLTAAEILIGAAIYIGVLFPLDRRRAADAIGALEAGRSSLRRRIRVG